MRPCTQFLTANVLFTELGFNCIVLAITVTSINKLVYIRPCAARFAILREGFGPATKRATLRH
jgi:hypothetical protein